MDGESGRRCVIHPDVFIKEVLNKPKHFTPRKIRLTHTRIHLSLSLSPSLCYSQSICLYVSISVLHCHCARIKGTKPKLYRRKTFHTLILFLDPTILIHSLLHSFIHSFIQPFAVYLLSLCYLSSPSVCQRTVSRKEDIWST